MFDDFMVNTWIAATLVAGVAGIVGFFVVVRGASFAAHALPLTAFPGAAAANLAGVDPLFGLLVFSGLGVTGISQLARSERRDVATALTLVTLLGLGALFLSRTTEYFQAVYALLFGQVLGVSNAELAPVAVLSAVSVTLMLVLFRPLLLNSISPELGEARGVSARLMEVLFLTVVALATAMALPVVGALLVFSLMVGPASAARADRPAADRDAAFGRHISRDGLGIDRPLLRLRLADRVFRRRPERTRLWGGADPGMGRSPSPMNIADSQRSGPSRLLSPRLWSSLLTLWFRTSPVLARITASAVKPPKLARSIVWFRPMISRRPTMPLGVAASAS